MITMKLPERRKLALYATLAVALVSVGAWASSPDSVTADVATVDRGCVRVTLAHEGRTRLRTRHSVTAPAGGHLMRVELEPGDRVRADQTLATIRPGSSSLLDGRTRAQLAARAEAAGAAVALARARTTRAEAEAGLAAKERARAVELAGFGAIARQDLDRSEVAARGAEQALTAAQAELAAAEHDRAAARVALIPAREITAHGTPLEVRSPIAGVILRRVRESAGVVAPGELLVEVGDPADLEIVADYSSTDAIRLTEGTPVEITGAGDGRTLAGRVRRVEPTAFSKVSALGVEEQRVNVIVSLGPGERGRLGDGFLVEVRAVVAESCDVVRVPAAALFREGSAWAVYAVEGGSARRRLVDVGRQGEAEAEVVRGLAAGDRVVVHPPPALRDGVRVAVRDR